MANYAKIRIEFTDIPMSGREIRFELREKSDNSLIQEFLEVAKPERTDRNEYAQGVNFTTETIDNLNQALKADYTDFVIIKNSDNTLIDVFAQDYGQEFIYTGDQIDAQIAITEEVQPDPVFGITNIQSQPPQIETPCNNQRLVFSVENEVYPIQIKHSAEGTEVTKTATQASELWIELTRQSVNTDIILTSDYGDTEETDTGTIPLIAKYGIEKINVTESLSGATITIVSEKLALGYELSLSYSLNGVDWVDYNSYSGILPGTYTAYIRDEYNCIKSLEFIVEGLETPRPDPFLKVEKANPLKFVEDETPAFYTVNNTLLKDYSIQNTDAAFWRQPFKLGDVVRTQIKTSYRNLTAKVINNCTGEISQTLTPERKVKNIGKEDKRDCVAKDAGNGINTYIWFPQGDIYNPETDEVISTYYSRGELPVFAQIGMFVDLTEFYATSFSGEFQIKDIVYLESEGYWALVIDAQTGFSIKILGKCRSIYNAEDWDIYEFNFTDIASQFHVEIDATDDTSSYPDKTLISEPIFFTEESGLVHLKYTSEDNQSKIDYSTGIVFELNVPGRFAEYSPGGEDETFEDDFGRRVIQKAVYIQQLTLQTALIPMWLAEKIIIASTHEKLEIDGESCTMSDRPEVESKLGENNKLYLLTGIYQLTERVVFGERTGIVSTARGVLGTDSETIIGV